MSFMQPEITDKEWWVCIDGDNGTEFVPCDCCGRLPDYDEFEKEFNDRDRAEGDDDDDCDGAYREACVAQVKDYTTNRTIYCLEETEGFGARMSAPGYLDATDWCVFDTEEQAIEYLLDTYDNDSDELEDWVKDLLDRLYELNPKSRMFRYYGYKPASSDNPDNE